MMKRTWTEALVSEDNVPPIETLPNELYFEIIIRLETFEDRWVLGIVNQRWKTVYRLLLDPKNDGKASEFLNQPQYTDAKDSCGPTYVNWWRHGLAIGPPCGYRFDYGGKRLLSLFGLDKPDSITCYHSESKFWFDVYVDHGKWMICYKDAFKKYVRTTLPNPSDGDVFDQVPRAQAAFRSGGGIPDHLLPLDAKLNYPFYFNPALARRVYNFPAFVRIREELLASTPEYVDDS